jgi:hypothetical protein
LIDPVEAASETPYHVGNHRFYARRVAAIAARAAAVEGRGQRHLNSTLLLIMWVGISHTGGFDTAAGQTDPGIAPPYLIMLIITFVCWRITHPTAAGNAAADEHPQLWIYAMRLAFGFLWAWDALFKWHPYYLTHLVGYLTASQQGEPAWLATYTQAWIDIITAMNPVFIAVLAALLEAILAWSLITERFLRVLMPTGFVYSLVIWSTAEGFGGPYSAMGQTGMTGNMLGNAVIYALIFLGLMAAYRWPKPLQARA